MGRLWSKDAEKAQANVEPAKSKENMPYPDTG
jgi:hypothetical protein